MIKWKKLFILLAATNIIVILLVASFLFAPASDPTVNLTKTMHSKNSSEFFIRTSKANLNDLMNAYLDKALKDTQYQYTVSLDEDVQLAGELPVFSSSVALNAHLEPIVQDNGDIVLKPKSIALGQLPLPSKTILKYIDKYLPMPEWVKILPNEQEIYVQITDIDVKSNFKVAVSEFDLEANNIAIRINVPYKTLGIDGLTNPQTDEEE